MNNYIQSVSKSIYYDVKCQNVEKFSLEDSSVWFQCWVKHTTNGVGTPVPLNFDSPTTSITHVLGKYVQWIQD